MSSTARLELPFILPAQAQKEVYHNEALMRLDMAVHAAVEEGPLSIPPQAPQNGQSWTVGAGAVGDWACKEQQIAGWTDGGWRFIFPQPGMTAWNKADGLWLHWIGGLQIVGERQPAVPSPSGGTIIDQEVRNAINAIIATLMSHGLTYWSFLFPR